MMGRIIDWTGWSRLRWSRDDWRDLLFAYAVGFGVLGLGLAGLQVWALTLTYGG